MEASIGTNHLVLPFPSFYLLLLGLCPLKKKTSNSCSWLTRCCCSLKVWCVMLPQMVLYSPLVWNVIIWVTMDFLSTQCGCVTMWLFLWCYMLCSYSWHTSLTAPSGISRLFREFLKSSKIHKHKIYYIIFSIAYGLIFWSIKKKNYIWHTSSFRTHLTLAFLLNI